MGARDEIGGAGTLGDNRSSEARQHLAETWGGRVSNGKEKAHMQKQINRGGNKYIKKGTVSPQISQQRP